MLIPKGLKVGDKFNDEGREYVVEEVNSLGYVSRFVGMVGKTIVPTVETVTEKKTETIDYEAMGIRDLQKIAKDKGLIVRGSKAELVERLKGV